MARATRRAPPRPLRRLAPGRRVGLYCGRLALSLAPVLLSVGAPLDGIGLLLGVDQVPDMFRTATNVAGHLTAAAVIARGEGETLSAGG